MDVDPAPHSTISPMEEEEKTPDEPMAQEVIAPPLVSQGSEQTAIVPPSEQKEKALVPESQKAAKGVPTSKNDGSSSSSKPSVQGKPRKPHATLKPIEEGVPAPDDIRTRRMIDEESLRNPLETFPLFPVEDGPNGPAFNEQLHNSKLAFFGTSLESGHHCHLDSRLRSRQCIMLAFCSARIAFSSTRFWILQSSKVYRASIKPSSKLSRSF
jgi:hypothetical protein